MPQGDFKVWLCSKASKLAETATSVFYWSALSISLERSTTPLQHAVSLGRQAGGWSEQPPLPGRLKSFCIERCHKVTEILSKWKWTSTVFASLSCCWAKFYYWFNWPIAQVFINIVHFSLNHIYLLEMLLYEPICRASLYCCKEVE